MVTEITMSSLSSPAESITEKDDSSSRLEKRITVDSVLTSDLEHQEERKILEKKLVRKIDLRMSILVLIYILNYIDRANAGSARLRGFEHDLNLQGNQFATVLAIYFVGYILMQVPSNMLMSYMKKPSLYLPGSMIAWGTVSALTGVTHNYHQVVICRFFLGLVEAAFFPGAVLLLSRWYKRDEMGLRTAILFCGLLTSVGWGSLFASGILSAMQGKLGHPAWRWLYYIEGAFTVLVAICAMFILPDFPENSSNWLSPAEQALAIQRMREDAGRGSNNPSATGEFAGFKAAMTDWKTWWLAFIYAMLLISISFNVYFPTLMATLGYSRTISLILCAPPAMVAAVIAFFHCRHSDKHKERFWHIAGWLVVSMLGCVIMMTTMNKGARYFGFFIMGQNSASYIVFVTWISNSFYESPAKRSAALGFTSAFAQLGGVAGSYIFPVTWGPTYRNSFAITLSATFVMLVMCYIYKLQLARLNRKFQEEEDARGQKEPGFRYLL